MKTCRFQVASCHAPGRRDMGLTAHAFDQGAPGAVDESIERVLGLHGFSSRVAFGLAEGAIRFDP